MNATDFITAGNILKGDSLVWRDNEGHAETSVVTSVASLSPSKIGVSFDGTWNRGFGKDDIVEIMPRVCGYAAKHTMNHIPATTTINCGPVGTVAACQPCADFYDRMSSQ